ncbi:bifunctional protein-serine/threonine kinase/phosphatase [Sapientia aquatica]|uniref:Bifunctional protein-serine/threonine kinase/phosphatase n=1 Tax=Sapientia aquatica TaxID=1549640 RepID=A0A4R5W7R9_9BURK|nr:bifunctional protein-serine/threonine kinase/phosphatase [Sapientia aquatica]TDK68514.1 bifunctional protein-serine/threonine kinase/phosphatase [Sapientia aquatica]
MPLTISIKHASIAGHRAKNEDFVGMVTPLEPELSSKGMIAAIADGVSGNQAGRDAAEYSVRGLLSDYYATPDTWEITSALEKVIVAINSWVQHQGSTHGEMTGMATTLTSLVMRGRMYYTAHVGDSRAYLFRDKKIQCLTQDHVWDRPEMQHVLTRAIGLDTRIAIDHGMGELHQGDIFLLVSDGLWSALNDSTINYFLGNLPEGDLPDDAADLLCQYALSSGSQDNISAIIIKVIALPEGDLRDTLTEMINLTVPNILTVGQKIDGLLVQEVMHTSATTILYRVFDDQQNRQLVLKTLHPDRGRDHHERSAFAHEAWLAKRVVARFFPQVVQHTPHNYLYFLTSYHPGASLQQKIDNGRYFSVPEIVSYGCKLVRAVGALHRRSIIHRDIKPSNIHLGDDSEIRLLDLGTAQSGWYNPTINTLAGTPSYLAPEQFENGAASVRTDIYAIGISLYYLLTRHYPYGEIEPFHRPRFGEPVNPSRYRPELPMWLETILLKAVAKDPLDRFETTDEFLLALERGASRPLDKARPIPLIKRDPVLLWRSVALASFVLNLFLLYWVVVS